MTVNGHTMGDNCREAPKPDGDVIWSYDKPLVKDAGFLVLRGNLFDSAIMKTSVISKEFRDRYLINPEGSERVRGPRHRVRGPGGLSPRGSTIPRSISTSTASCSCAAPARSAIPAAPRS